jgi:hypothetical protein
VFHHTRPDLDPLMEIRRGDRGTRSVDVSLDRIDADTGASRARDEGDQMPCVSAADIEEPAVRSEERPGKVEEEVRRPWREAFAEQRVELSVIVSVDELHLVDLLGIFHRRNHREAG